MCKRYRHIEDTYTSVSMSLATDCNGTESTDGNSKYVDPFPTSLYASGKISCVSLKSSNETFPKPKELSLVVKRETAWRPVADPCNAWLERLKDRDLVKDELLTLAIVQDYL